MILVSLSATAAPPSIRSISGPSDLGYSSDSVVKGTGSVVIASGGYVGPFCVVFTQLSLSPTVPFSADALSYGLYKPAESPTYALSLDGTPSSKDEVLSDNFPSGSSESATTALGFAVLVSPLKLPPPETYTAQIKASLYACAYPPAGSAVSTKVFSIRVTVGSHYDLSVVPTGSGFALSSTSQSLAFGTITPYDKRGVDLVVHSNVAYNLSITSAKGGVLATASDSTSLIGYTLTSNASLIPLVAGLPSPIATGAVATYSGTSRYALVVTISAFSSLPTQGDYSDTLTVTLAAP
jgi:hypothetical protein